MEDIRKKRRREIENKKGMKQMKAKFEKVKD